MKNNEKIQQLGKILNNKVYKVTGQREVTEFLSGNSFSWDDKYEKHIVPVTRLKYEHSKFQRIKSRKELRSMLETTSEQEADLINQQLAYSNQRRNENLGLIIGLSYVAGITASAMAVGITIGKGLDYLISN